jgi:hypothetical protein
MEHLDNIGRGFRLVHRNWQLVLIHAVMLVINVAGFLIFVGIPLIAGIAALGLDAAKLGELEGFLENIGNPFDLISEYVGLFLVILLGIFVYITFVLVVWVYVLGGSAGVLGRAIKDPSSGFSMKRFFSEGRRLFFPLMGYMTVVGLILIGISILLGLLAFIAILLAKAIGPGDASIGFFFRVLFTLGIAALTTMTFFLVFALSAVGSAPLVLEGTGPMVSLDRGFKHLKNYPGCLWLLGMLILGYTGIQLVIGVIGYGIQFADGLLLSLPYQIFANIFQGYLSLIFVAAVLVHFHITTVGDSIQAADISPEGDPLPAPPPAGSDWH